MSGALRRALASVLVLVVTAAMAVGVRGDDPLATADLVRFLRAGISERIILAELPDGGYGEPLDSARETELRDAGATETLIVAVRRLAPASAPAAPAAAPGTQGTSKGTSTGSGDAGFPTPTSRVHGPTFGSSTRTVRVPVSVLDKREPVMGLRAGLQIRRTGRSRRSPASAGAAALTSRSPSTEREHENKIARWRPRCALHRRVEPEDEILVLTFNDNVDVVQDFTSDRNR